jgi:hypothetical protein
MSNFDSLIKKSANEFGINWLVIKSVCIKESNMNPWVTRFEPKWKWFVTPENFAKKNMISNKTEINQQMTSFGLMQVMGCVIRELGFTDNLNKILIPENSIKYGAMKLKSLLDKYVDLPTALAAYNAGNPNYEQGQIYAKLVLEILDRLEKENKVS